MRTTRRKIQAARCAPAPKWPCAYWGANARAVAGLCPASPWDAGGSPIFLLCIYPPATHYLYYTHYHAKTHH